MRRTTLFISIGLALAGCALETGDDLGRSLQAQSNWCDPPNPPGTYDFYPGTGFYPSGDATSYPWGGEDFESYADNETIECSTNQSQRSHLEVTSGCLIGRLLSSQYRRGYTTDHNFRMLAVGLSGGQRVKWTRQSNQYRGWISSWQAGAPDWAGFHLFARYRTENDLYVASFRKDGTVTIKRKLCGAYSTLASGDLSDFGITFTTGAWYTLRFEADGSDLRMYVNGTEVLTATDGTFSWGTSGIRIDYANAYIDDWIVE